MIHNDTMCHTVSLTQYDTGNDTKGNNGNSDRVTQLEHELSLVKTELEAEKRRVQDKQETIDSLKTALKLLEHKPENPETTTPQKENTISEPQENINNVNVQNPFKRWIISFLK